MWNENMVHGLHTGHGRGGVALSRHEIARQAYVDKIRARHEAEKQTATTGVAAKAFTNLKTLAKTLYAGLQSHETQARPAAAEYPAE